MGRRRPEQCTQGAWRVAQVSTSPQVPDILLSEPQRYPWNPRCTPSLGIHGRSQRESSLAPEGGLLGKASTTSEHAENSPSADWVSSPHYTKVAGPSKSIFFCANIVLVNLSISFNCHTILTIDSVPIMPIGDLRPSEGLRLTWCPM